MQLAKQSKDIFNKIKQMNNKCTKVTSNEQLHSEHGKVYSKPAIGFRLPTSNQFWLEQGRLEPLLDVICDPVRKTPGSEDHTECGNNLT